MAINSFAEYKAARSARDAQSSVQIAQNSASSYASAIDAANAENRRLVDEQRKWSDAQASRQMAFQERMSNTAHQREVADLIAAGLNPILTATGGSGAQAMSGSSAESQAAQVSPASSESLLQNVATQAYGSKRLKEYEMEQLNLARTMQAENIAKTRADTAYTQSNTLLNQDARRQMDANILLLMEQMNTQRSQQSLNSANALAASKQAGLSGAQTSFVMGPQTSLTEAQTEYQKSQTVGQEERNERGNVSGLHDLGMGAAQGAKQVIDWIRTPGNVLDLLVPPASAKQAADTVNSAVSNAWSKLDSSGNVKPRGHRGQ